MSSLDHETLYTAASGALQDHESRTKPFIEAEVDGIHRQLTSLNVGIKSAVFWMKIITALLVLIFAAVWAS